MTPFCRFALADHSRRPSCGTGFSFEPYSLQSCGLVNWNKLGTKDFSIWVHPRPNLACARRQRESNIHRSISWLTTRIQTKNNRAKKSLESTITIRATCPGRRWMAAKTNLNSEPTLTGYAAATRNKIKAVISEDRGTLAALVQRKLAISGSG